MTFKFILCFIHYLNIMSFLYNSLEYDFLHNIILGIFLSFIMNLLLNL